MMVSRRWLFPLVLTAAAAAVWADGPGDNRAEHVRPIPPPGIALSAADEAALKTGVEALGKEIESLPTHLHGKPALLDLLPDVQVYHNAVRYAVTYHEFFAPGEIAVARSLLKQGLERASQLRAGKAPWATATGLVVRGYVSKIDGSVQPYGLVVPASYQPRTPHRYRLDAWFHGRGETLSELHFINDRQRSPGEFTPPQAFVLHPYGRYCNANKFAGEVDLFEALANVRKHYPIDENRTSVRGFSMGGAACWQFAVHYAGLWAAAAPGAGFAETADFLKVFQDEDVKPAWYERKLWHLYDSTDYAVNLFNCPTVAYSGAIDRQKQAADMMARALKAEGITLAHVIGPGTAHAYHPDAKDEINRRLDSIIARGRNPVPRRVRFTTWTLRYHRMLWVTVDGLDRHWERARVDAAIADAETVKVKTENVSALTLSMAAGYCPLDNTRRPKVILDGQELEAARVFSDRSWAAHFRKTDRRWTAVKSDDDGVLRKRHGLQGPIDDAFMGSFLMVRPTGKPLNEKVGSWARGEMAHAIDAWRRQFRGEARVKNDSDVTDADIAAHNLVLWGDPGSNKVLAKIADKLPIRWDAHGVRVGEKSYPAAHHVPVLIYPNPLNPRRYVVLNSGFTYREYDYLNNARQVPKLPDFAVVDVNVPPSSRVPGGIVTAGFFDERWQLPAAAD
ncbi:MAG TPA: prolyl oligopeptidase family serine peptidase [Gemmataceae bacterium]|jgi:dienelactone hydrolase|nr:prolyl oligopeptidase family serine peptidase [Gemmataceae bacterium]